MSRKGERLLTAAVALLLGTGAALVVDHRLDSSGDRAFGDPGDRVLEAVEGLRDDRVHVSDDGRAMLDEEGEAAVAAAIAERDLPVHVVVWRQSWFAGYDHYIEAAEQVLHQLDEPGVVVLWQGPEHSTTQVTPSHSLVRGDYDAPVESEPEYLGDAALRITEWLDQLPDDPVERREFDYYGGPVSGVFIGLLYGLPIVLGVWILLGIARLVTGRRFRNLPVRD